MKLQRLHLRALLAGSMALALSSCATSRNRDDAVLHMRIGTAFLEQGRYPNALRELLEAEKLDAENPMIQNNLGLAYFLREKHELAAQHLARAIELDPKFTEARNNYGRVLIELGKFPQAIAELERVTRDLTYTQPAKGLVNLGLARFRQGNFDAARKNFLDAVNLDREDCLAHTLYGRSLFELNRYTEAASALDNAVVVCKNAKFDEPHYFSGLSYYKLGRTSDAISRMEEVITLYPGSRYAKKAESLLQIMK